MTSRTWIRRSSTLAVVASALALSVVSPAQAAGTKPVGWQGGAFCGLAKYHYNSGQQIAFGACSYYWDSGTQAAVSVQNTYNGKFIGGSTAFTNSAGSVVYRPFTDLIGYNFGAPATNTYNGAVQTYCPYGTDYPEARVTWSSSGPAASDYHVGAPVCNSVQA